MIEKEMQVIVQQTPGTVCWNFEELKADLNAKMESYKNLVYTEETLSTAKKDVAMLRKLRKSVEDRRKEIKSKCLEPYALIEDQAKQLVGLIDAPIGNISDQIDKYETERKEKKREKILSFMQKTFAGLDPVIAKKLQFKIYDTRWENKSGNDNEWLSVISDALKVTEGDLEVLNGIEEAFQPMCMDIYRQNLVLNEALAKANELRRQQEMIREQERRRAEAIQRQVEAQEKAQAAAKEAQTSNIVNGKDVIGKTQQEVPTAGIERGIQEKYAEPVIEPKQTPNNEYWILFKGDKEKLKKVLGYIKFLGAEWEVRRGNVVNG